MKLTRTSAAVDFRLVNRFDTLRRKLTDPRFADRWDKPLAFWALPNDRRLPLAFLDRTVEDLLRTPFDSLLATPGVGRQKIAALLRLLARAARETAPDDPWLEANPPADAETDPQSARGDLSEFIDPTLVSEAVWVQWRQAVVTHGLEDEPLGRYAPTLEHLPRVLWNTPLRNYTQLSLAEIRRLRTHGEKRVNAVLEVFGSLFRVLGRVPADAMLAVRVEPKCIREADEWATTLLAEGRLATPDEVVSQFVRPLLDQIRLDAGDQVADLAASRLGIDGSGTSVRQAARGLGLTRARVYQLLADVAEVLRLRWPAGARITAALAERILDRPEDRCRYQSFAVLLELAYPPRRQALSAATRRGTPAAKLPDDALQRAAS